MILLVLVLKITTLVKGSCALTSPLRMANTPTPEEMLPQLPS